MDAKTMIQRDRAVKCRKVGQYKKGIKTAVSCQKHSKSVHLCMIIRR